MTIVFTLCSNNYLARAVALGESVLHNNPDYIFQIGLVDRKSDQVDYTLIPFEIAEVESIGITAFEDMFNRYSITELNTAVKPFYFQYFFKTFDKNDICIYLDPDILVYNAFEDLEKVLEENEIVITPHLTTPLNDDKEQAENDFLNTGLYNLGFIALKKGEESQKLINWWSTRLETKAFVEFEKGMFTDQLWINFAPLFFKKVHVLTHPGYNMAYWNLHERRLTSALEIIKEDQLYPLVFFHFSGYDPLVPEIVSRYQNRFSFENRKDIVFLFDSYRKSLIVKEYGKYIEIPCYYAVEKSKKDLNEYDDYKSTIPVFKRIIRGIILRFIKIFKFNIDYYIH